MIRMIRRRIVIVTKPDLTIVGVPPSGPRALSHSNNNNNNNDNNSNNNNNDDNNNKNDNSNDR